MSFVIAIKFLTRLGILTAVVNLTKRMGIWVDPDAVHKVPDSISEHINHDFFKNEVALNSICQNIADDCSAAQYPLSQAIRRGYYLAYRLPDWTFSFLTYTNTILDEKTTRISSKKNQMQRSEYVDLWRHIDQFGVGLNPIKSPTNKPPKIKDDITCGKRVLV